MKRGLIAIAVALTTILGVARHEAPRLVAPSSISAPVDHAPVAPPAILPPIAPPPAPLAFTPVVTREAPRPAPADGSSTYLRNRTLLI